MRLTTAFTLLLVVSFAVAGVVIATDRVEKPSLYTDPVEQWSGINFSHRLHIEDVGAECGDCHETATASETSDDLLLPGHDTCEACHEVDDDDECATCHGDAEEYVGFQAPEERLILFNHRLHVEDGEVDCLVCHGGVPAAEGPDLDNLPGMEICAGCHNHLSASNACELCHVEPTAIIPASHLEVDWAKEHKRWVRIEGFSNECAVCHDDTFCQTCHAEVTLQSTRGDFLRTLPEWRPQPEGKNPLVVESVHELNYLFTHPQDAKSKRSDCASCHDAQLFCADCHSRNQDAGFGSPFPTSHGGSDFVRIGVGSGGGRHAEEARRDIETCASCHDVEGRDPVCLTCHVDRTPGRGNDPRTHPGGFRNEQGEWHSNPGSVCFFCHTDTRSAGIGFCGYCHGAND